MKLLLDENLRSGALWKAIQERQRAPYATADIVRVGDPAGPPLGSSDEFIIAWAASQGRVVISQDQRTLERAVAALIDSGGASSGVGLFRKAFSVPEMTE